MEIFIVKIKKLKSKNKQNYRRYRKTDLACPNCMSVLIIDESGNWKCSGNKLDIWIPYFEEYDSMDKLTRNEYLATLSKPEKFLEYFKKWVYLDSDGQRANFSCGYSNKLFPVTPEQKTIIPDPATVASIERRLGRGLTLHEKEVGEVELEDIVIEIPKIKFPQE